MPSIESHSQSIGRTGASSAASRSSEGNKANMEQAVRETGGEYRTKFRGMTPVRSFVQNLKLGIKDILQPKELAASQKQEDTQKARMETTMDVNSVPDGNPKKNEYLSLADEFASLKNADDKQQAELFQRLDDLLKDDKIERDDGASKETQRYERLGSALESLAQNQETDTLVEDMIALSAPRCDAKEFNQMLERHGLTEKFGHIAAFSRIDI